MFIWVHKMEEKRKPKLHYSQRPYVLWHLRFYTVILRVASSLPGGLAEVPKLAPRLPSPKPPPHRTPPSRPVCPKVSLTMEDEPFIPALTGQAEGFLQLHLGGHSAGVT